MNGGTKPTITGMWCWFNHWIDRLTNQERKSCRFWSYLLFRQTHLGNLETLAESTKQASLGTDQVVFYPKMSMVHSLARFIPHSFPSLNLRMLSYLTPDSPCLSVWSYFGWFSPHFLLLKSRCWLVQSHSVLLKFQRFGWINPHLVGGLENEIYDFPYFIIPTDSYFSEGVETTNQSFLLETTTLFHL